MLVLLYTAGIACYHATIHALAPFHAKAAAWVNGRKGIWKRIEAFERGNARLAWFHVASLGEFEQGRPLVEMIREREPGTRVVITFFSPSGHEARANYPGADAVFYLPQESPRNARRFIRAIRPDVAIFVKYDFWYHYLHALRDAGIPTYLLSARFRAGQLFFRRWGVLHRRMLGLFEKILVQDDASARLLRAAGITRVDVTGDTRFDRVLDIAANARAIERVERFRGNYPLIVCGSTWPADEKLLLSCIRERGETCRWVIVPHEVDEPRIRTLVARCGPATARFSDEGIDKIIDETACHVLVIDRVGLLSSVYRHATIAYIGGGFGRGIHNTLEAAVYGIPVVFGPAYRKFGEAIEMIRRGCAFPVNDDKRCNRLIDELLSTPARLADAGQQARAFVQENAGATARAFNAIKKDLPE
ncbi:MAG: 3-deoxy-D-manno-octulosonic acid transferase [Odoribacteraceae bacterium]|jgi:3-deoxy-D-manno-octulosonic-acid transferase|nr:3-deoxy-D-manno-octulosonic acid transferase [Odoribacteraceae bacterium]